jgi:multimeric flavodoxin WrbA
MPKKKVIIISGSPKKNGNTAMLIKWFRQGAALKEAKTEVILAAYLKLKFPGCSACRICQKNSEYGCVIEDGARIVLDKIMQADVIVMATPLYFFSISAQLKIILDRMFSLYKWDNHAGTMNTALKGKTLVLLASAFEKEGLDALKKPFVLTAQYSKMKFLSLLVADAGVSGEITKIKYLSKKAIALGKQACS